MQSSKTERVSQAVSLDNPLLDAALTYAARGWRVLPLRPEGKTPLTPHGVKDATTDPETIRAWWARWPEANVGIATGAPGPVVLDFDGPDAATAAADVGLDRTPGPEVRTGKGFHRYFAAPAGVVPNKVRLAPDLDIRASGGYVVAPPSRHPRGGTYTWTRPLDGPLPPLPPLPLLSRDPVPVARAAAGGAQPIPEGQRNATLASLAGTMRRRGMTPEAIEAALLAENQARCQPPLPADEVRRIAASIARYPAGDDSTQDPEESPRPGRESESEPESEGDLDAVVTAAAAPFEPPHRLCVPYAIPMHDATTGQPVVVEGASPFPWEFCQIMQEAAPGLPEDWALGALLAAVGVLIPHLRIENLRLNVWMLGIGRQSVGKGLVLDAARCVAVEAAQRCGVPLQLFTSGTPEGLLRAAQDGPVLAVFEEARGLLERIKHLDHQAGFKQTLCQLYDGRAVEHRLKKEGSLRIDAPFVGFLAAINASDFPRAVQPEDVASGWLSRMLFVAPDPALAVPHRVPGPGVWQRLGVCLAEHLQRSGLVGPEPVCWASLGAWALRPEHAAITLDDNKQDRRGGVPLHGYALLLALLRGWRVLPATSDPGARADLDADAVLGGDLDDGATPAGRDLVRAKKLAVLFEVLSRRPRVQEFTDAHLLPDEARPGDRYLAVRDENIVRAAETVLRGRAYAQRALRWVGQSEDVQLQERVVAVLQQHGELTTSDLLKFTNARGVVYLNRVLEALEASGRVTKKRSKRGFRWQIAGAAAGAGTGSAGRTGAYPSPGASPRPGLAPLQIAG